MDSSINHLAGIDMNVPRNLELFSQIIHFKNDYFNNVLLFRNQHTKEQRVLQSFAHSASLQYDYFPKTRTVKITRLRPIESPSYPGNLFLNSPQFLSDCNDHDFVEFGQAGDFGNIQAVSATSIPLVSDTLPPTSQDNVSGHHSASYTATHTPHLGSDNHFIQATTNSALNDQINIGNLSVLDQPSGTPEKGNFWKSLLLPQCLKCKADRVKCTREQPSCSRCTQWDLCCNYSTSKLSVPSKRTRSERSLSPVNPRPSPPSLMFTSTSQSEASSLCSGSQASFASSTSAVSRASSGRKGPLSQLARTSMNVMRKLGACWRCKLLRNSCDPEDPCVICPKSTTSNWGAVGCRRGDFKTSMPPIILCPFQIFNKEPIQLAEPLSIASREINAIYHEGIESRSMWMAKFAHIHEDDDIEAQIPPSKRSLRFRVLKRCESIFSRTISTPYPVAYQPLHECLLSIVWELLPESSSQLAIMDRIGANCLASYLAAAVVYQTKFENDQLIAQSLICLRNALEVFRMQESGALTESCHRGCGEVCQVEGIENLKSSIDIYLKELTRVFFKKENLRHRSRWWLSIFYSFCIQSVVRKTLIQLALAKQGPSCLSLESSEHSPFDNAELTNLDPEARINRNGIGGNGVHIGSTQYLHLPVRLFIARSGLYDPILNVEDVIAGRDGLHDEGCREARLAFDQFAWESPGIASSSDLLRRLFEDDGRALVKQPRDCSEKRPVFALARLDFLPDTEDELPLVKGQRVRIIESGDKDFQGWVMVEDEGTRRRGVVPGHYISTVIDLYL